MISSWTRFSLFFVKGGLVFGKNIMFRILIFSLSVYYAGCREPAERVIYRDYPVEFDDVQDQMEVIGDPEIILGIFEEQLFTELHNDDEVPIVYGLQGGTWLHLSIRVFGLRSDGEIDVSLTNNQHTLGEVNYLLRLVRSAEGFLEAYDIPVPVTPPNDMDLSSIFGEKYTITIGFASGEKSASANANVVLIDG